jgi:hypothetical protein
MDKHAQNGSLDFRVNRTPHTLLTESQNLQVKELLALNHAYVSTHDGKKYAVALLVFDGNGKVHGDNIDHHYNFKNKYGKNPNDSINLLVQLANNDAGFILGSAHDLLRNTKGYTKGLHPARSSYVHSKGGYLGDGKTPIPTDNPAISWNVPGCFVFSAVSCASRFWV